jgi:hypothetical protein
MMKRTGRLLWPCCLSEKGAGKIHLLVLGGRGGLGRAEGR